MAKWQKWFIWHVKYSHVCEQNCLEYSSIEFTIWMVLRVKNTFSKWISGVGTIQTVGMVRVSGKRISSFLRIIVGDFAFVPPAIRFVDISNRFDHNIQQMSFFINKYVIIRDRNFLISVIVFCCFFLFFFLFFFFYHGLYHKIFPIEWVCRRLKKKKKCLTNLEILNIINHS